MHILIISATHWQITSLVIYAGSAHKGRPRRRDDWNFLVQYMCSKQMFLFSGDMHKISDIGGMIGVFTSN